MERRHAAWPAVAYVDPLGDGVFAPPRSFASARKSSQTAAFGALGSRSDVRDEISSTGDFDLPWRALENDQDARACVRIPARPRMRGTYCSENQEVPLLCMRDTWCQMSTNF